MDFAEVSLVALRVFREVAERGTLTSAAAALGYTQSAVSRQVASLERAAGAPLLERRHDGVRPTTAGHVVLRHGATVLDQIDAAARELAGLPPQAGDVSHRRAGRARAGVRGGRGVPPKGPHTGPALPNNPPPRRAGSRPPSGPRLIRGHRAPRRAGPGRARRVAGTTAHHPGPAPAPAHRASRPPRRRPERRSRRRPGA